MQPLKDLKEFNFCLKMKKFTLQYCFYPFIAIFCRAQSPGSKLERIEVLKMAYITKELNLTPDEAQKFWPVYNNYTQEIRAARQNCSSDPVACEEKMVGIKKGIKKIFAKY